MINGNVCNEMIGNLEIEELNSLKSILVMKNSLKNLNSLTIRNCELLEMIEINGDDFTDGSFSNVMSVEISSMIDIILFI